MQIYLETHEGVPRAIYGHEEGKCIVLDQLLPFSEI